MSAATTIFKCRFNPILPEVEAKLQKVRDRIFMVCVDGQPLRALGSGVDCVEADSDFAFEVATDCVQRQAEPLAGFLALGPVVVMLGIFRVGMAGLERVGATINEEAKVVRHHAGGRFEKKLLHYLLPEAR
jgi:hypothetical protein